MFSRDNCHLGRVGDDAEETVFQNSSSAPVPLVDPAQRRAANRDAETAQATPEGKGVVAKGKEVGKGAAAAQEGTGASEGPFDVSKIGEAMAYLRRTTKPRQVGSQKEPADPTKKAEWLLLRDQHIVKMANTSYQKTVAKKESRKKTKKTLTKEEPKEAGEAQQEEPEKADEAQKEEPEKEAQKEEPEKAGEAQKEEPETADEAHRPAKKPKTYYHQWTSNALKEMPKIDGEKQQDRMKRAAELWKEHKKNSQ